MDSQEDSNVPIGPSSSDQFDDRREEVYRDHRFADEGPTRGTHPDNGHTGVQMGEDGKVVATAEGDGDTIRADGMSDQLNIPDHPDARVVGSILEDDSSSTT